VKVLTCIVDGMAASVKTPAHPAFEAGRVITMPAHNGSLGRFPHFKVVGGAAENGGTFDRGDITAHVAQLAIDIDRQVPEGFDGIVMLDLEHLDHEHRLWRMYVEPAVHLVRRRAPKAHLGQYDRTQHADLFDVYFPSLYPERVSTLGVLDPYAQRQSTPETAEAALRKRLDQFCELAASAPRPVMPIISDAYYWLAPWGNYNDAHFPPVNAADAALQVRLAWEAAERSGAEAIVVWANARTQGRAEQISAFLRAVAAMVGRLAG
jgi:hypothetical protein